LSFKKLKIKICTKELLDDVSKLRFEFLKEEAVQNIEILNIKKFTSEYITDPKNLLFVLEEENYIIGICSVSIFKLPSIRFKDDLVIGYLSNFYIKKNKRDQNYGKQFYLMIEKDLKSKGIHKTLLQCKENISGFYNKLNFIDKIFKVKKFK